MFNIVLSLTVGELPDFSDPQAVIQKFIKNNEICFYYIFLSACTGFELRSYNNNVQITVLLTTNTKKQMFSFITFILNKCLFSIIYIQYTPLVIVISSKIYLFWKLLLGNDIFVLHKMNNSSKFLLKIEYMKLYFRGLSHVGPRSVIDWSLGPIFWTLSAMLDPLYPILTFWPILNQGNIQSYPADQSKTDLSNPNLLTNLKPIYPIQTY